MTDNSQLPASRQTALEIVESERIYQDQKWGPLSEHPHEVGAWLTIMRKLLTDAEFAYCGPNGHTEALAAIRKVTATGFACLEQHGAPKRS